VSRSVLERWSALKHSQDLEIIFETLSSTAKGHDGSPGTVGVFRPGSAN
jgi:hypothetical protein